MILLHESRLISTGELGVGQFHLHSWINLKSGTFFFNLFCRDIFGADLTYCLILRLPFGVFVFNCMTWSFPAVTIVVAAILAQYSISSTVAARRWICGDSLSHVSDMHCLMIFLCTVKDACLIKWPSRARKQSWASPCMQMWRGTFPPDKLVVKEKHSAWGVSTVKAVRVESQHLASSISPGESKQTCLWYDAANFWCPAAKSDHAHIYDEIFALLLWCLVAILSLTELCELQSGHCVWLQSDPIIRACFPPHQLAPTRPWALLEVAAWVIRSFSGPKYPTHSSHPCCPQARVFFFTRGTFL